MDEKDQASLYEQELMELGELMDAHDLLKKRNDQAERQRVVPNRADRRAASSKSRKKARGG